MKIFFIGANKTGTITYNSIMKKHLKSFHGSLWAKKTLTATDKELKEFLEQYDCYSDNFSRKYCDFKRIEEMYPDAKFILNTRSLVPWLKSRIKHIYRKFPRKTGCAMAKIYYDNEFNGIKTWITYRNSYNKEVIEFFRDKPGKLLVLDIESENIGEKLSKFTGMNISYDGYKRHVRNIDEKNLPLVKKINEGYSTMYNVLKHLNISEDMYNDNATTF